METTPDEATLERAAAAVFVDYPPTPAWYPYASGLWFTGYVGGVLALVNGSVFLAAAVLLICLVLAVAFLRWYSARWGGWPRMAEAPREIRGAYRWYIGVLVVAVLVTGAVWWAGGAAAGLVSVFVTMTALSVIYERRVYPRAADRVRMRLV